jgi:ubiquinone/menaquinone biosynthesis C-methylase UbiE
VTRPVDYDRVAPTYDSRYERNDFSGVRAAIEAFVQAAGTTRPRVLEAGCGTGHWVRLVREMKADAFGIDRSAGMLAAASPTLDGRLIRGRAESLPCCSCTVDRIYCVNALHHFEDPAAFIREARRALRPGGGLLTIGLDPHSGRDQWWVYDYFPEALVSDRKRYLSTSRIRQLMEQSGFSECATRVVQHMPRDLSVDEAARAGFLDRVSTSQLMVIPDAAYEAGLRRIQCAADSGHMLASDLRLYGTNGWLV